MNKCILIGNITKEVEIIYTKENVCIGNTSLAINRHYSKDGQAQSEVCYIDLRFYGKQAEACKKYLTKGSKIGIIGRLEQNSWMDNGNKKSKYVIVVSEVEFLNSKKDENEQNHKQAYNQ